MNEKQTYSINDAAEFLGVAPGTVYKMVHEGTLHAVKIGRSWRIARAELFGLFDAGVGVE